MDSKSVSDELSKLSNKDSDYKSKELNNKVPYNVNDNFSHKSYNRKERINLNSLMNRFIKENRRNPIIKDEIIQNMNNNKNNTLENNSKHKFIIIAWKIWRIYFNLILISIFFCYNHWSFSYEFNINKPKFSIPFYVTNGIVDITIFVDIIINALAHDYKLISNKFITFLVLKVPFQFLTSVPWYLYKPNLYWIKLLRIISLFTDTKNEIKTFIEFILTKLFTLNYQFISKISNTITLLFIIFLSSHVLACLNNYLYKSLYFNDECNENYKKIGDDYVASLYFIITTFSTVGYGDLTPKDHTHLYMFTLFLQFFGILVYGYWVGIMRKSVNYSDINLEIARKEDINFWLLRITRDLIKKKVLNNSSKITKFLEELYVNKYINYKNHDIFNELSANLQRLLIFNIKLGFKPIKNDDYIFEFLEKLCGEELFVIEIIKFSIFKRFEDGKIVIKQNKKIKYFYIIIEGSIVITRYDGDIEIELCTIPKSSIFGESFIIFDRKSKYNYKAKDKTTCLCIDKKRFIEILKIFNYAKSRIIMLTIIRNNTLKKLWKIEKNKKSSDYLYQTFINADVKLNEYYDQNSYNNPNNKVNRIIKNINNNEDDFEENCNEFIDLFKGKIFNIENSVLDMKLKISRLLSDIECKLSAITSYKSMKNTNKIQDIYDNVNKNINEYNYNKSNPDKIQLETSFYVETEEKNIIVHNHDNELLLKRLNDHDSYNLFPNLESNNNNLSVTSEISDTN